VQNYIDNFLLSGPIPFCQPLEWPKNYRYVHRLILHLSIYQPHTEFSLFLLHFKFSNATLCYSKQPWVCNVPVEWTEEWGELLQSRQTIGTLWSMRHSGTHHQAIQRSRSQADWYTKEEYGNIKMRGILIVRLMAAKSFHESGEHTFQGLECHKLDGKFDNWQAQQAAQAILHEQQQQALRGIRSLKHIARMYATLSRVVKWNATWIAQCDAEYVVLSEQTGPNVETNPPSWTPMNRTASLENDATTLPSSTKGKDELGDSLHLAKIFRQKPQCTKSSDQANFGFPQFSFRRRTEVKQNC